MCGISGISYFGNQSLNINDLKKYLDNSSKFMSSRGPDGNGTWINDNHRVGFSHRRLAIIDTREVANQPMVDKKNGNVIVFNGEIYNYKELKHSLIKDGYKFHTESDTEVILKLYHRDGVSCIESLNGMFAFAIWDDSSKKILLFRDPLGIKPLYYYKNKESIFFASQAKAIYENLNKKPIIENAGLVGFYLFGHVPEPFTIYQGILSVDPGSCLSIDISGQIKQIKSFSFNKLLEQSNDPTSTTLESVELLLNETIAKHLISDVPLGVFLSAGLDSAIIFKYVTNILRGKENNYTPVNINSLKGITLGFHEYKNSKNDESVLASLFASQNNIDHSTSFVSYENFLENYEDFFRSMDQPTIDGLNTYFVSLAAKKNNLKVVLSGLGGDEIFQGYSNFKSIPRHLFLAQKLMPEIFGGYVRNFLKHFLKRKPKISSVLEYSETIGHSYLLHRSLFLPWELESILEKNVIDSGLEKLSVTQKINNTVPQNVDNLQKISSIEMQWYMRNQLLRDSDWASMAHSIELRVPFVDLQFIKGIFQLQKNGFEVDKDYLRTHLKSLLPDYLLSRNKTGFSTPVNTWLLRKTKDQYKNPKVNIFHPSRSWALEVIENFI